MKNNILRITKTNLTTFNLPPQTKKTCFKLLEDERVHDVQLYTSGKKKLLVNHHFEVDGENKVWRRLGGEKHYHYTEIGSFIKTITETNRKLRKVG